MSRYVLLDLSVPSSCANSAQTRRGHRFDLMVVEKLYQQGAESGLQMRPRMKACETCVLQSCAVDNTSEYRGKKSELPVYEQFDEQFVKLI